MTSIVRLVNATLLALGIALILYYVLSANSLTASTYYISALREDLAQATDQQTKLSAMAAQSDNLGSVNIFASTHNMIVARDALYIFENGNIALVR